MNYKKLFIGLAVVALIFGVTAVSAKAQTIDDLLRQIAELQRQLQEMQGGGGSGGSAPMPPLTVGSTGEGVRALQQWLNSKGYTIAASGPGSPGMESTYFGALTQAALARFQAANGISPAAGYYGNITYNFILSMGGGGGGGGGDSSKPQCSDGIDNDGNGKIDGYDSDCTDPNDNDESASGGGQSGKGDGTDGSITIATSALVSSGTQVKKGETKNVLSTRLQATTGPVSVNRVEVKFSERPWLTMNQVQLKDGNGNVLATKALTGPGDATEVTVGSDYRVRFDNVNFTVTPGTDVDLLVAVSVMSSSDKITGQTVTTSIPASGIRTTNGIGFSETIGPSASFTFTLPTTGSTADIYTSISSNSPTAGIQQVAAGTTQTENVVLARYRIKAQNTSATLNSLGFSLNNSTGIATSTLFSNVRLQSGSFNYGANSLAAGETTFTNMQVSLPLDQWVEFTLTANVAGADTSGGVSASTTLDASTIGGIDANYNSLTISNAGDVTSADRLFLQTGVGVSGASAALGNCPGQSPVNCGAEFRFTLTNTGNNAAYISKTAGVLFATTTIPANNATSTITSIIATTPSEDAGDTSASYAIQAGASRDFLANGNIGKTGNTTGSYQLKVTRIYFGASATAGTQGQANTNASNYISSGLGNLVVNATF